MEDFRIESAVRSEDEERLAYMSGQRVAKRGGSRDENEYVPRNLRTVWDWGFTSGEWSQGRL